MPNAFKILSKLFLGASGLFLVLLLIASSEASTISLPNWGFSSTAVDTDSVHVALPNTLLQPLRPDSLDFLSDSLAVDSLLADSLALDSVAVDTTRLVQRYIFPIPRDSRISSIIKRDRLPFYTPLGTYWNHSIKMDSTGEHYVVSETVRGVPVRDPFTIDLPSLRQTRLEDTIAKNFRTLNAQQTNRRLQRNRGFGFDIQIPGGQNSAFTTLFGTPEVSLRVNGQANIDAGFARQVTEDGGIDNQPRTDPTFGQNIRLGITGSIGDKLRIDVNWDTQRQFEYENQIKLEYTGYEDEIIQKIVAGNVTLQTPSSLINGGRSLFGVRTDLQLGGVDLTIVASQQKGSGSSLKLDGGSEVNEFKVSPLNYEDEMHFFMGYYFRNHFDDAVSSPTVIFPGAIERITDIEVWKLNIQQNPDQEDLRNAIAIADLAEERVLLSDPYAVITDAPNPDNDAFTETTLNELRDGTKQPSDVLTDRNQNSYSVGSYRLLERDREYYFDDKLGFISLTSRLTPNEALAVAYRYIDNQGRVVEVGDLTGSGGSSSGGGVIDDRLVLKLLRRPNQVPNDITWTLMMRNIYRLGARNINLDDFELEIVYQKAGSREDYRPPEVTFANNARLLEVLGLDRESADGRTTPDQLFDTNSYLFDALDGRIMFPYVEPFGNRLREAINAGTVKGISKEEAISKYVVDTLYAIQPALVKNLSQFDIYQIKGSNKSSVQSTYNLGFALVQNSVKVYSNGNAISASDYIVNYDIGTIEITNPAYLTPGNNIEITYERENLFTFQQKNLLGIRADYRLQDKFQLGGTMMRLVEKPAADKFRVGQEPISNVIWGLDGSFKSNPRWLSQAIDALPLIQTKTESSIDLRAEFAQFRPRTSQTIAYQRKRSDLRSQGQDFEEDEQNGISYIDDFEGLKTSISLNQPGFWRLSSSPDSLRDVPPTVHNADSLRSTYRGRLGWFQISQQLYSNTTGINQNDYPPIQGTASEIFEINQIFAGYDVKNLSALERLTSTLNLFFDPSDRGPYNYTTDFDRFLDPNKRVSNWGGMMQRIPEGYTDFNSQNIEFIEFIFRPYTNNSGPEAKMYIDLGTISEDVLPNGLFSTEDGLSTEDPIETRRGIDPVWGIRLSNGVTDKVVQVEDDAMHRTEDLGLDGLSSYDGYAGANPFEIYKDDIGTVYTEQKIFSDFLEAINPATSSSTFRNTAAYQALYQKALRDPSADDFHDFREDGFFQNSTFFPEGVTNANWYEYRFNYHFGGHELNSFEAQKDILGQQLGNTKIPDTEDINQNNTPDLENNYYQYEIPLDLQRIEQLAHPDSTDDYIISKTSSAVGDGQPGWYLVRIPVRDFSRKVGNIQDFSLIQSIRVWTTGHREKAQIRFFSFDLVGSQWRASREIGNKSTTNTSLGITTVNNEEDSNSYVVPYTAVVKLVRNVTGGSSALRAGREQAMQLTFKNLQPGDQRAAYKTVEGLDLLKYESVRMFTHMHGLDQNGFPIEKTTHNPEDIKLFVRFGTDQVRDYYEYELPLTPADTTSGGDKTDGIWQTNQSTIDGTPIDKNSLYVVINHLKTLKNLRDADAFRTDSVYWHTDSDLGAILGEENIAYLSQLGARIGIKGNPSLSRVSNIVIGVRNTSAPLTEEGVLPVNEGTAFEEIVLWVNELRVAGYDQEKGWAMLGTANFRLADLATINANIRQQTDSFGSLDSQLGGRQTNNTFSWGVSTNFSAHKLLPERAGWSIPISYSYKVNNTIPRFSPDQGDIRISDQLAEIEENPNLSAAEKQAQREEVISKSETNNVSRSLSVPISKRGSESKLLQYLVDPISITYNQTAAENRNPTTRLDESWRWGAAINYRINVSKTHTIRPFWFLGEDIPVIRALGKLHFNYVPSSIQASATTDRDFKTTRQRPRTDVAPLDETATLEERIRQIDEIAYPYRQNHSFGHKRNFSMQYNPFSFLAMTYSLDTQKTILNGIDSLFTVRKFNLDGEDATIYEGGSGEEARFALEADTLNYLFSQVQAVPIKSIAQNILTGQTKEGEIWADRHSQNFSATFDPQLQRIRSLSWLQIRPISFTAGYAWQNQNRVGASDTLGAGVSNRIAVRGNVSLQLQELWRKIRFIEKFEQEQKEAEQNRNRPKPQQAQSPQAPQKPRPEEEGELTEEEQLERRENPPEELPKEETTEPKKKFSLPLPSPRSILRRSVLALTGIRDISFDYNGSSDVTAGNIRGGYAYNDPYAPSAAFRFGFNQETVHFQRVNNKSLQIGDDNRKSHKITSRGNWDLSNNLKLNFNFDASLDDANRITYRDTARLENEVHLVPAFSSSGKEHITGWTFGASIEDMIKRQLQRFVEVNQTGADTLRAIDGVALPLTNTSVVTDFRKSFLFGTGSVFNTLFNYTPIPLPNWQINYTGLSKLGFMRRLFQSATVKHGYVSTYDVDYQSNAAGGTEKTFSLNSEEQTYLFAFDVPNNEVRSIRINERFAPLIELSFRWKFGLQTDFRMNSSRSFSFNSNNFDVTSNKTQELEFRSNYSKQGLKLPFKLPFMKTTRLNNTVRFSFIAKYSTNEENVYSIRQSLEEIISDPAFQGGSIVNNLDNLTISVQSSIPTRIESQLQYEPRISYTFSNKVTADAFLTFRKRISDNKASPDITTMNGGFNVRVNISN